jgi:hypothetical protein
MAACNVRIMLVVNKFLALVIGSKTSFNSFAVLPGFGERAD